MKDIVQAKEKLKSIPFITLAFVFTSYAVCIRDRERERERERLANAHVFCLDGDVVPQ